MTGAGGTLASTVDAEDDAPSKPGAAAGVRGALVIEDLVIRYGSHVIVPGANLAIEPGEFVTLLGPSGSGKTSILRAVAGYVTPAAGDIRIGGRSVVGLSPRLRNCGMVFQSYALFPHMTVAANVAFGLKTRKLGRDEIDRRVAEILEAVHLAAQAGRYPHQLSGGQQQRVALARALVIRPDLLLMDEPLAALDLRLREELQVEIRRIQQEFRISTLFVTHDQGEAFTLSDRIMVMNAGEIVSCDRPREVYLKPSCSFTARFVGSASLLEVPLAERADAPLTLPGLAHRFRLKHPPKAEARRIFAALRPEVIRCRAEPAPGWSTGQILSRRFSGMNPLLMIAADGHELLALDPTGDMRPGQPVWFQWNSADAHVIEETERGLPCPTPGQQLVPI